MFHSYINNNNKKIKLLVLVFVLSSCGGGGGGGSDASIIPNPTVVFSGDLSAVYIGNSFTLTWSSTNASSCSASGGWDGSKSTSGS